VHQVSYLLELYRDAQSLNIKYWITFCFEAINQYQQPSELISSTAAAVLIPNQRIFGTLRHIAFSCSDQFYKNLISVW
jgi:hypothetical protein